MWPRAVALAVVMSAAHAAHADTSWQASARASSAWTDNAQGATGGNAGSGDFFLNVHPTLALISAAPRLVFTANYAFDYSVHFQNTSLNDNAYANQLDLSLGYELSKRLTLTLGAGASEGGIIQQRVQADPGVMQQGLVPANNPILLNARATEGLGWAATPAVRVGQSLLVGLSVPLVSPYAPVNYAVTAGLTVDRSWRTTSLGGELRVGYSELGGTPGAMLPVQPTDDLLIQANARLRRDLTPRLTSLLSLGVAQVVPLPDTSRTTNPAPTGQATLTYTYLDDSASIGYQYGLAPDLVTGAFLATHQVTLRGLLTLTRVHPLILTAQAGYAYSTTYSGAATMANPGQGDITIQLVTADIALNWAVRDEILVTARYSLLDQIVPATMTMMMGPSSVLSNTVMLGLSVRYPAKPMRIRAPNLSPSRVDRGDARGFPGGGS